MFCCLCHAVPQNTAVPGMRRAQGGSSLQGVELCPTLSVQGSQPSTASPFKQDVFIYSASPGSDSPSVGAAATPVIMSRSPTADIKNRNSPRSNLKFRFDKLSHGSSSTSH